MDINEQSETIRNESPVSNLESNNNNEITDDTSPIQVDNENSVSRQLSTTPPSSQPQPHASIDSSSATPVPTSIKKSKLESNKSTSIDIQQPPPIHEIVGGSSVRRYLNEHITLTLLEGLKELAQIKPEDPLKYLGEYLITKSNETK